MSKDPLAELDQGNTETTASLTRRGWLKLGVIGSLIGVTGTGASGLLANDGVVSESVNIRFGYGGSPVPANDSASSIDAADTTATPSEQSPGTQTATPTSPTETTVSSQTATPSRTTTSTETPTAAETAVPTEAATPQNTETTSEPDGSSSGSSSEQETTKTTATPTETPTATETASPVPEQSTVTREMIDEYGEQGYGEHGYGGVLTT